MISILIPTYNTDVSSLLQELDVQCQRLTQSYEIIVADDFSVDTKLREQNKKAADSREIHYIQNQQNLGRIATRKLLAKSARYDWLLFLDADVLPKESHFVQLYIDTIKGEDKIIFGGISYRTDRPKKEEILRWFYGKHKEAKHVSARQKAPHFIISQNILFKKDVFFEVHTVSQNRYGLDNIVSFEIKKKGFKVKHIDNPVIHLGLETTETFLKKSIQSLETTEYFETNGEFPSNFRPIQRVYLKLKKTGLLVLFKGMYKPFKNNIEKNLYSNRPFLFLFDLYRLFHYAKLKENSNA